MTTEQIKNFLAVAEVLNFHKASSTMFIAQPALSRQIKNLEDEIGAILFDRTKKQIKLTAAGVFFKNEMKRVFTQFEQTKKRAGQIHRGEAGEISMGHVSSAMQSVLPPFLRKIKQRYPEIKVALTECACTNIVNKIMNRELDFGVMPNVIIPAELDEITLYKENFVVVMPKSFKISSQKNERLKALAKADWILPALEDSQGYNEILYRLFHKNGFWPKVVFESPNATTNLRLVSEGLGVTIIGKSAIQNVKLNIKHFEITEASPKVEMRFVWLKEKQEELKEYIELFLKIFGEIKTA